MLLYVYTHVHSIVHIILEYVILLCKAMSKFYVKQGVEMGPVQGSVKLLQEPVFIIRQGIGTRAKILFISLVLFISRLYLSPVCYLSRLYYAPRYAGARLQGLRGPGAGRQLLRQGQPQGRVQGHRLDPDHDHRGPHGFIFRWGSSSVRLISLDLPQHSSVFFDFHALFRCLLTFREKSPAKNKTIEDLDDEIKNGMKAEEEAQLEYELQLINEL